MPTDNSSDDPVSTAADAPQRPAVADWAADDQATLIAPITPLVTPTIAPPRPTDAAAHLTLPGAASVSAAIRKAGRYLIQESLGSGGMASVFKAHDPEIGRDVAIKFLHANLCADADYRGRFLREARAAGSLSHPNIVTVHDVGEIEGRPYMAMELLTGDPLSTVMEAGTPLPLRQALVIGLQLARALDYAHAHGIVHRDIKPGNIVCMKGTDTIKVTDFGIAHMESSGVGEQRTRIGDVLGTPQYMSPEQTLGERLDGRSDLFSTGIVLYQMLTGQRPFQGDSLVALAVRIAREEPPAIGQLRPEVPTALRRIVERCLAKPRERRFQTGGELADALARVLNELDEAARQASQPRVVPLRIRWAATMALVVAVVTALAAFVVSQRQDAARISQVTDYGASLARFVAAQNAVPALSEDWPVVSVAVHEVMKTGDFHGITVVDRDNIVRAAGDPALEGQPYKPPAAVPAGRRDGNVMLWRTTGGPGEPLLGFEAPITFQNKPVGRAVLWLSERPLSRAAQLPASLMAALVAATVLVAAVAMYLVAKRFSRPIKLASQAMDEIARGNFEHRIAGRRKDEFGLLFAAFDRMAQALQDGRATGGGVSTDAPPPPVAAGALQAAGAGQTVPAADTSAGAPPDR